MQCIRYCNHFVLVLRHQVLSSSRMAFPGLISMIQKASPFNSTLTIQLLSGLKGSLASKYLKEHLQEHYIHTANWIWPIALLIDIRDNLVNLEGSGSALTHVYSIYYTHTHVAKVGEVTGKTRVLYSELGETGKTRVLPGGQAHMKYKRFHIL